VALEKTQARVDALSLANEGRLFVDPGTSDFAVKSELSDTLHDAQPPINDAASDLRDDLDLEDGEEGAGPEGTTPVVFTPQGADLYAEWTQ
jgi:hypothetical protein